MMHNCCRHPPTGRSSRVTRLAAGLQREAIVQKPLWDNFELPLGALPSRLFEEALQSSQEVTVCNCRSRANGNRYNLVFRSA